MKTDKKQARWRRLLRKAANFLRSHNLATGAPAKNINGERCRVTDKDAVCYCLVGALMKVSNAEPEWCNVGQCYSGYDIPKNNVYMLARKKLKDKLGRAEWQFNDGVRDKQTVINKLLEVANS